MKMKIEVVMWIALLATVLTMLVVSLPAYAIPATVTAFSTLQEPVSYVINTVTIGATTYYGVQNYTTGKLEYYSTDATQVFQFTLGNCPHGEVVIVKKANYSDVHIVWEDGWDNITLAGEDGALLCQNRNTIDIIELRGSEADPLENVVISGFYFKGCNQAGSQSGVHMTNTRNCIIENNYFDGMASAKHTWHVAAIYLAQSCNNNRIDGNTIYQGTFEGIGIGGGSQGNIISGNVIRNTSDNGIDLNGQGCATFGNIVVNNDIAYTTRDGIHIDSAHNTSLIGNTIRGTAQNGVLIGGHEDPPDTAYGNQAINNTVMGEGRSCIGIFVAQNAYDTIVSGNKISGCTYGVCVKENLRTLVSTNTISGAKYGVFVSNNANFAKIVNNVIYGVNIRGIQIENASQITINGGFIADQTYGIFLKACNYTSIVGIYVYNSTYRPLIESTIGGTCDYNLLDDCYFVLYKYPKEWGAAGHDVTGNNVEIASPTTGTIFNDGFEPGSFSAWTGSSSSASDMRAVTTELEYQGFYSARFTTNGTVSGSEYSYCYKTIAAQNNLYTRGYFYVSINGIQDVDDRFFLIQFGAGSTTVAYAGWRKTAAGLRWVLTVRNGNAEYVHAYSTTAPSLNKWYCVELHWMLGTSTGLAELFVNGARVCYTTGKNTAYYGSVNSVRMGLPTAVYCAGTRVYADNAAISTRYIGP